MGNLCCPRSATEATLYAAWELRPDDMEALQAWHNLDGSSAGIVSTVRGADEMLHSFIAWHLSIGFTHMILYLDDPNEMAEVQQIVHDMPVAASRVRLVSCDDAHRAELEQLTLWPKVGPYIRDEIQARQVLNAEHALGYALTLKLAWLLHMDKDEAFYCGSSKLVDHFSALKAENVTCMRYVNFEAVVEDLEVRNPLTDCTLFRRNLAAVEPTNREAADRLIEALEYWGRRSHPANQYFQGYTNGKSVVAVMPGALPWGVHAWLPASPMLIAGASHNFLHFNGLENDGGVEQRLARAPAAQNACILHYHTAVGYSAWRKKHMLPDVFMVEYAGVKRSEWFREQSLAVCGKDEATAMTFYRERVVVDDHEEVSRQLAAGLCVRVNRVADVLRAAGPSALDVALSQDSPLVHVSTA